MRENINNLPDKRDERLSRRGETIYYFGTLFFVAGIILLAYASISIMFFQIHYESEATLIADTVMYMGTGLFFVAFGINLMLNQSKRGYIIFGVGSLLSIFAIIYFYFNYETNWFYPIISYVLLSYLLGFLLLMGNAFGHVTLWILQKNQEAVSEGLLSKAQAYYHTDEEIQRDIDNAMKQSLHKAAENLQFDLSDKPAFKVSAHASNEDVVRRKDTMNESMVLQQTLNPGTKEKWGATGVDKASMLLADTLKTKPAQKTGFFHHFTRFFH
ncbi:MAG: hypothetical protein R6U21_01955 [Thermoplasmatota archaeon]